MEKPLTLTLLYTANIRGDIHMLPRLYTYMQTLKPEQRQGTLILDLGQSCAPDVWHCDITNGRSTLIVLDGMGYHAANVEGQLDSENYEKTADVVTMGLVDADHPWAYYIPPVRDESIQATLSPTSAERLNICLSPKQSTYLDGKTLYLTDVEAGQLGMVEIDLHDTPKILSQTVHTLPENTQPNPTIVASVEFVESEARYYQKKNSDSS